MKMRPFDSVDWSSFAGAEGDAQIGGLEVRDLKEGPLSAVAIADDNGLQIILEEDEGFFFNKKLTRSEAIAFAEMIPESISAGLLLSLGFDFDGPDQGE